MDKIGVLFLDNDDQYCSTLTSLLSRNAAGFSFYSRHTYSEETCSHSGGCIDIASIGIRFAGTIVFYNPSEYHHPPDGSHAIMLADLRQDVPEDRSMGSIYRYSPVCDFVLLLEEYVDEHPELADSVVHRNFCCIAGQGCSKARKRAIFDIAEEKVREGYVPVLIELCPRHECIFHPDASGNGNTLSDAMLRLMANDLNCEELGTYMVPADCSILQFRAFECTDDIFECSPDNIRKFVEALRKWDEHTAHSHFIIISCHSIPFSFVYRASVLCDSLIILNMTDMDFNASEYNRELSSLLANLPDSCSVSRRNCSCSREGGDPTDEPIRT